MESHATPLLVLPQSELVENTTKFIQDKLNTDKCCKDWICPQNLVMSLAPTKFYKSQNQYLPTDINVPNLEADASLLDLSNKGRSAIPIKNLEAWEKKARKLTAINSHADLFSSAAYLCLQQESMSVVALSRLLEAVAKSIRQIQTSINKSLSLRQGISKFSKSLLDRLGLNTHNHTCLKHKHNPLRQVIERIL